MLRSSRLLTHHGKKLPQLHGASHDAFDGQELEKGVTFPDLELMRGCIEKPRDRVASALSINVIGLFIYLHVAPRINMAEIGTAMQVSQPGIWVHLLRQERQAGPDRKGDARRLILAGADTDRGRCQL